MRKYIVEEIYLVNCRIVQSAIHPPLIRLSQFAQTCKPGLEDLSNLFMRFLSSAIASSKLCELILFPLRFDMTRQVNCAASFFFFIFKTHFSFFDALFHFSIPLFSFFCSTFSSVIGDKSCTSILT